MVELLESAFKQIQLGGWVMYPLVITSLWMWYLIGKKLYDIHFLVKGDRPFVQLRKEIGNADLSAAAWQRFIVDGYMKERTGNQDWDESIIHSLQIHVEQFIDKYTGTIKLLAMVSPLLGLLGTVSGMVKTFVVIAEFGTGNARALASGISEALITTQTGLVVAVPGLFMASFLLRRSNGLVERIDRFCLRLSSAQTDTALIEGKEVL
jgi:biopolymer transport protein ExbB